MSDGSVVQLHLRAAGDLAHRLNDASDSYLTAAGRSRTLLERAGAPTGAATILQGAGDQLRTEAHDLADLVAQVRAIESGEQDDPFEALHISHTPYRSPFIGPGDASKAADDAWQAFRDHDDERFLELNERWSTEPDYATAFASHTDPAWLVDRLDFYRSLRQNAGYEAEKAASIGALQTLSVASRTGGPVPTFASLREEVDRSSNLEGPSKYDILALLFEPDVQWSTQMLVDAVQQYVLPANREVLGSRNDAPYQIAGHDGRVLVLEKLAADQWASARILDGNLDALLPVGVRYGDGGKALGRVLIAGTAPGTPTASARVIDVIDWVATHHDLPPLARDDLGLVAAPYIGSFRSGAYKGRPVDDPLPSVDSGHAREFLWYAAESERARRELHDATIRWGADQLRSMAPTGPDKYQLETIGNVFATATGARYHGSLRTAADQDQAFDDEKKGLNTVFSLMGVGMRGPTGTAFSIGLGEVVDAAYPSGRIAEDFANRSQAFFAVDQLGLNSLLLQTLWESRDQNHRFVGHEPPAELIASDGRLKTFAELEGPERSTMLRWQLELEADDVVGLGNLAYGYSSAG